MTDDQVEKIIKSNMNLQMNLAGIRQDFEEKLQRTWVGLTDEEWEAMYYKFAKHQEYGAFVSGWDQFARAIEAKLKEKNT